MVGSFVLWQTAVNPGGAMRPFRRWTRIFLENEMAGMAGLAVATAWLGLALGGRWRRPEDWMDRFGRILGWGWIGVGFVWALTEYWR